MEIVIKLILVLVLLIFVTGLYGYFVGGGSKVYVAIAYSEHNGLQTKVIGVFRKKETAESRAYQYTTVSDNNKQSLIIECVINKGLYIVKEES